VKLVGYDYGVQQYVNYIVMASFIGGGKVQVTMPKPYIEYKIISSSRSRDNCYESFHYGKHEKF
jgi:hypothetical protein